MKATILGEDDDEEDEDDEDDDEDDDDDEEEEEEEEVQCMKRSSGDKKIDSEVVDVDQDKTELLKTVFVLYSSLNK